MIPFPNDKYPSCLIYSNILKYEKGKEELSDITKGMIAQTKMSIREVKLWAKQECEKDIEQGNSKGSSFVIRSPEDYQARRKKGR